MSLKVYYKNKEVVFTDKDYVAEGGEGVIYVKNGKIFKIYHDIKDVLPAVKFDELSVLDKENIVVPKHFIYNAKGVPIGFTMAHISNTVPLPRIFTTSYRTRYNITPEMSIQLVGKIAETIQYIHDRQILIVDGNEFNYLIDGDDLITPYFIDVDSYQTKSFPAKVIMPSIRDWQAKAFSELTDWYSFAIIATQIFIGIHPFKGTHPSYDKTDLKGRMLNNISVLNKDVSIPPATRDFGLIPSEYMTWFMDVFEKGKRTLPPIIAGRISAKPQVIVLLGRDKFIIDKIFDAEENIAGADWIFGNRILYVGANLYINNQKKDLPTKNCGIIYFNNESYFVDIDQNHLLSLQNCQTKEAAVGTIAATKKLIIENRIYVLYEDKLTEIELKQINNKCFITPGNTWNILPNATKIFREIIYSDVLGKAYLYIPYREKACSILAVPELNKHKIIDAKYENGICIFLTNYRGTYNRITLKFSNTFTTYQAEVEKDVLPTGINFVSLPNNVYILYTGEGEIIVGSRIKPDKKVLTNISFDKDMILCHNGLDVYYYSGKSIFRLKMK